MKLVMKASHRSAKWRWSAAGAALDAGHFEEARQAEAHVYPAHSWDSLRVRPRDR
jgi:hypothetical protein